jgi:hypothetical protein
MSHTVSIDVTIRANGITAHAPLLNRSPDGIPKAHRSDSHQMLALNDDGRITAPHGACFQVFERPVEVVLHVESDLVKYRPVQSFVVTVFATRPALFRVAFHEGRKGLVTVWAKAARLEDDVIFNKWDDAQRDTALWPLSVNSIVWSRRQVFRLTLPRPCFLKAA